MGNLVEDKPLLGWLVFLEKIRDFENRSRYQSSAFSVRMITEDILSLKQNNLENLMQARIIFKIALSLGGLVMCEERQLWASRNIRWAVALVSIITL